MHLIISIEERICGVANTQQYALTRTHTRAQIDAFSVAILRLSTGSRLTVAKDKQFHHR